MAPLRNRLASPAQPQASNATNPRPFGLKWLIVAVLLCLFAALVLHRGLSFRWRDLGYTFAHISPAPLLAAIAALYAGYVLRAIRWHLLLPPAGLQPSPQVLSTFGPQVIGFTAIALFGRIADLVRPWLIARRLGTSLATQLAVYSVERVLDVAAAAAIIASPLLYTARTSSQHPAMARISALALLAVLALGIAVLIVRLAGEQLPTIVERLLARISPSFSHKAAAAVRDFQLAFRQLKAARFLAACVLSLLMWAGIAVTYTLCAHACQSSSVLASLSFADTMPVFAASLGGSLLQLPVLGWFTQIGVLAAALHATTGVRLEPATVCGVLVVCTATLSVVPAGLIAAHRGGLRMRDLSGEAQQAS